MIPQSLLILRRLGQLGRRLSPSLIVPIRCGHTDDFEIPNYDKYRREDTMDPEAKTKHEDRKALLGTAAMLATVAGLYSTKAQTLQYVLFMAPSAEVLAMARIEIRLTDIALGTSATFKWRGKPLFIWHRDEAQIASVRQGAVLPGELRDPENDEDRVQRPEWLVLVGVCTHLGCVPVWNAGDYGGYYCPCHGSHFDASGRIRKGPAPTNLEVPQYKFLDGDVLLVG